MRQDVAHVEDQVEHVGLAAKNGGKIQIFVVLLFVYFLLEHDEEGGRVAGEEDDEEGDPVERLPLDLLVVLLPQLQLPVRLGEAEEDLGEAEISRMDKSDFYIMWNRTYISCRLQDCDTIC